MGDITINSNSILNHYVFSALNQIINLILRFASLATTQIYEAHADA